MLQLFTSLEKEVYWVQVNLKDSISLLAHYVIVISVVKDYSNCIIADKIIAIMQDNSGKIGLVQNADINESKRLTTGRSIFLVFLQ